MKGLRYDDTGDELTKRQRREQQNRKNPVKPDREEETKPANKTEPKLTGSPCY